jgi:hypothetical protein
VFSIFSSVSVSGKGQVDGTATSIFSSINLSGDAVVNGDVSTVFSTINKGGNSRINGQEFSGATQMNWPGEVHVNWSRWDRPWRWGAESGTAGWLSRIFGGIFSALILAAVSIVTVVLFPRRVAVVKDTVTHSPWASLGVGFLGLVLSGPLALLLLITCIGFFVVIIGTFFATLLGLVAIGLWIGGRVMDAAENRPHSAVMDAMVGALILGLIMGALQVVPWIGCLTGLVWFGLFSVAFGAVLLSRFGSVPPVVATLPAPPPMPPAPPAPPSGSSESV